jgi:hypothetical protein
VGKLAMTEKSFFNIPRYLQHKKDKATNTKLKQKKNRQQIQHG